MIYIYIYIYIHTHRDIYIYIYNDLAHNNINPTKGLHPILHLRKYPVLFGLAVAKILEELKASAKGCPATPGTQVPAALASFLGIPESAEADLYEFAKLGAAYEYIRGGKSLRIPQDWRAYLPQTIP